MSDVKTKNPVGRPKFEITDEVLLNVENLMTKGLTKEQASGMLGVSLSTFMLHQSENSEFSDAIKRGKDKGIATITNALFNKAREGDNTAMIFYLKNQAGWQDKTEKETIVENRHILDLTKVSTNDLNLIERALESALIDQREVREDEKVAKRVYQE